MNAGKRIEDAIARLEAQLPLQDRQSRLSLPLQRAHRAVLHALAERGEPPSDRELALIVGDGQVADAILALGDADLAVLTPERTRIVGAYPMTTASTSHRLDLHGTTVNAMCALDALSVAPMYRCDVVISSSCSVTGTPIRIDQRDETIHVAEPSRDVRVGVHWQNPQGHAAHSMCLQMVFLQDGTIAQDWANNEPEARSIFSLDEAVAFGAGFFRPIVG